MLNVLFMYLQYPFVQRAIIVGVLVALCSSLLGVTLVLKRFSFIGDGLSHSAFGVMCIAAILHVQNDMLLILPATLIFAYMLLSGGRKIKIKGDASIAMISVSSLAVGYLIMNIFSGSANVSGDVCTTLFGSTSILTLTKEQMWLSIILAIVVVIIYVIFYNKIFAVTFDEIFAEAIGQNVKFYNRLIATVIAVIIVLAMKLVGSLLITALIVFPALSAMRILKNYKAVIIFSIIDGVICATIGMIIAIVCGTPVGATIVVSNLLVFLASVLIGCVRE